jgi:hypothetical protein
MPAYAEETLAVHHPGAPTANGVNIAPTVGRGGLTVLNREKSSWTLDEYVVVGELWLKRGRSVGVSDPDVKALAALLGRSTASISRRVGNFAGTDRPGSGLKPITGDALSLWTKIRGNPAAVAEAVRNARARLELLNTEGPDAASFDVRVVEPERPGTEPVPVSSPEQVREAKQDEATLREAFRSWREASGHRLHGIEISVSNSTLRVDLFDPDTNVLIEVKARADRDHLRFAVGQLYDYRRYIHFVARLAVLVPRRPTDDLMGLLDSAHVDCIWPDGNDFATRSAEIRADLISGATGG